MNNIKNTLRSTLVFSVLFFHSLFSIAQNDILELLPGSDRLEYDEKSGTHRLYGNVNFKYQNNIMYCDSAYYFEQKNNVRAYGNVHVNKNDTLNLYCDSLYYNGNKENAKLWGNVRVRDNEFKLTTDTLEYNSKTGQASYKHGGVVQSIVSPGILTSRIGYFHPDTKNFFFSHNVVYNRPDLSIETDTLRFLYAQHKTFFYGPTNISTEDTKMYCEYGWYNTETDESSLQKDAWVAKEGSYISGDTLLYQPPLQVSIGKGNVYFVDSTQKLTFKGDYAYTSDSLNYSFITGKALAIKELKDDTLYIHADTLYNFKNDTLDLLKAYKGASIYSTTFQCIADSIVFAPKNEKIELFTNPVVWSNEAELKGDFIDLKVSDSTIHKMNIYNKASILMEVEPNEYYNQIAGKNIIALFNDNNLYRADVLGNATTISFPEDTESTDTTVITKRMGMNRLYSSDLRIDIDSNEISKIVYLNEPDGVFYPMDKMNKEEQFLPNFIWMGALRPEKMEDLIK